jgi:hypothetical protein
MLGLSPSIETWANPPFTLMLNHPSDVESLDELVIGVRFGGGSEGGGSVVGLGAAGLGLVGESGFVAVASLLFWGAEVATSGAVAFRCAEVATSGAAAAIVAASSIAASACATVRGTAGSETIVDATAASPGNVRAGAACAVSCASGAMRGTSGSVEVCAARAVCAASCSSTVM